jgi:hypothetical protein
VGLRFHRLHRIDLRESLVHEFAMRCPEIAQVLLTSPVPPLVTMTTRRRSPFPDGSMKSMTLFLVCIPLMVLAVAVAVLPLILMSHAEHRNLRAEAAFHNKSRFSGDAESY